MRKFEVGAKIRVNKRAPQWVRDDLKYQRTRTIVASQCDPTWGCRLYDLGAPGKSVHGYLFRSYMLDRVNGEQMQARGQPRKQFNTVSPTKSESGRVGVKQVARY